MLTVTSDSKSIQKETSLFGNYRTGIAEDHSEVIKFGSVIILLCNGRDVCEASPTRPHSEEMSHPFVC